MVGIRVNLNSGHHCYTFVHTYQYMELNWSNIYPRVSDPPLTRPSLGGGHYHSTMQGECHHNAGHTNPSSYTVLHYGCIARLVAIKLTSNVQLCQD